MCSIATFSHLSLKPTYSIELTIRAIYSTTLKYTSIMKGVHFLLTISVLALAVSNIVSAYDPSPLQDFCVATNDPKNACKFTIFFFILNIALF